MIVSVGMTPLEAMLRSLNLTALLEVNLCRVSISPPFSEHCNCSGKSLEKPVRSTGTALQAHNLFGPVISTQGDIAEADVFNVTWTGSSISRELVLPFRYSPLKRNVPYRCKASGGLL